MTVCGCPAFSSPESLAAEIRGRSAEDVAADEGFWECVAAGFASDPHFTQLNYGYYHPAPIAVLEAEIAAMREGHRRGAEFKRVESEARLTAVRAGVAALIGAHADDVVLTRNASEALNIAVRGWPFQPGDEVICSDSDYIAASEAWRQRAREDGILVRCAVVPRDPANDEEVVAAFAAQLTPRTRMVFLTHVIHLTGQALPLEPLVAWAQAANLAVGIDAAHSLGQRELSVAALNSDFLVSSLHKWTAGPLGTGLLHVRRDRIEALSPLFGDMSFPAWDIRKLARFGNRPDAPHLALQEALSWHHALGVPFKRARLLRLQRRWTEALRQQPGFEVLSPRPGERDTALATVRHPAVPPAALAKTLMERHRLYTVPVQLHDGPALRMVPGLPTLLSTMDRLLEALHEVAQSVQGGSRRAIATTLKLVPGVGVEPTLLS